MRPILYQSAIGLMCVGASFAFAPTAQAQSALCPTSINVQGGVKTGFVLENGACTNRTNSGAFSGAALASQSLSGLSQSSTAESNRNTSNSIAQRREDESRRAANAQAQAQARANAARTQADDDRRRRAQGARAGRNAAAASAARAQAAAAVRAEAAASAQRARARADAARARQAEASADAARMRAAAAARVRRADAAADAAARDEAAAMARRAAARAAATRAARAEASADTVRMRDMRRRMRMAPPVDTAVADEPAPQGIVHKGYDPLDYVIAPEGPRFGVFAQGFGDYERRTGSGSSSINCCFIVPGGLQNALALDVRSTTRTAGFTGGFDVTTRNVFQPGDAFIAGFLTGYITTDLNVSTRITGLTENVTNGSAQLKANLAGPSAGVFATYFSGPFSMDFAYKADFYELDAAFTDQLAFTAQVINGQLFLPQVTPFSGGGRANLTAHSFISNANYRFPINTNWWIEPTVGIQYTLTDYGRGAQALGLDNGDLFRVQGGARLGSSFALSDTSTLTTTLAGLAYSDVSISGGFLPGVGFDQSNILANAAEGKVRGLGILTVAIDRADGISYFVQGNVRGGENLFGAGGRAGIRYAW